ncbi:hypothetical protein ACFYU5_19230 [Nocardia aobensis]|uniref:Uncharacterized protein n=1 Tax=Nocardia aobensis TaxID=257277 RepID=A0ABW6P5X2_9NOCA
MSESVNSDAANLLLASLEITQTINEDGVEMIKLEASDALGEPLGIIEALNLLTYAKLQLEAEVIRAFIDESEAEDGDE